MEVAKIDAGKFCCIFTLKISSNCLRRVDDVWLASNWNVLHLTACNQKKTFLLKLFFFAVRLLASSFIGPLVSVIGQDNLEMILPWIGFDLNSFEIFKISIHWKNRKTAPLVPQSNFTVQTESAETQFWREEQKSTGSRECIEQFEPFHFQPERTCTSTWVNPVFKPYFLR